MAEEHADAELLDYNDGDAGGEQADAPADDGAALQQAAEAAAAEVVAAEEAAADGATDGAAGQDAAAGSAEAKAASPAPAVKAAAAEADPDDPLSQPPHGTEVYIANLPIEGTEAQVRALATSVGEIFQLRLPRLADGRNKGYGFIVYQTRESAEAAVATLGGQELDGFPGRKVNVRLNETQSKNKLYFGNLPRAYTQKQLEDELKKTCKGVELVELMMDKENSAVNRGFAFVSFYNYACADDARKKFETAESTIGGRPVNATWAEPKRTEDTSQVRSIFVGGLPATVNEEKLMDVFKAYGEVEKIMLPYSKEDPTKYREYGFVHYKERADALEAVNRSHDAKPLLDGKELSVALARPQQRDAPSGEPGGYGGRGPGRGGYADRYGDRGYGGGGYGYGGRGGPGRGYGGRGGGGGYGDRGYGGRGGGGYGGGYGGRDYGYEDDYGYGEDDGYGGGGGYGTGYGAPAAPAAPAAATVASAGGGATMMVPVQLPSGQVGYMVVPAAGAAGAGGPVRRVVSGGYAAAATTAGAYAAGGYGYQQRSGPPSGGQYRSHPY